MKEPRISTEFHVGGTMSITCAQVEVRYPEIIIKCKKCGHRLKLSGY